MLKLLIVKRMCKWLKPGPFSFSSSGLRVRLVTTVQCTVEIYPRPQAPPEKSGKGPGSVSVYFLSTITSQNFEEPIRLRNETMRNVMPSHAHEAKSADCANYDGRVARGGVVCLLHTCGSGVAFTGNRRTIKIGERCLPIRVIKTNSPIVCNLAPAWVPIN